MNRFKELLLSRYYDKIDFFKVVHIETTNVCNRACPYCPQKTVERGNSFMDTTLFKRIIDQLRELKFDGQINLYRYGEPLLDKRLPYLISYVRKALPSAYIEVETNGDFLTIDVYEKLIRSGVDLVAVSIHPIFDGNRYIYGYPEHLKEVLKQEKVRCKVMGKSGDRLCNRGGLVPLKDVKIRTGKCLSPTEYLIINVEGKVLLCCEQYRAQDGPVFGDLRKERLIDIWNKPEFKQVRKKLRMGIKEYDICKKCGVGIWR